MFNDSLNVRIGGERRKSARAKVAAKMMQNKGRAAGLFGVARSGGGLGRQAQARFRPMAGRNMGALARLLGGPGGGGRMDLEQAIGRFGVVERQPGANDPGAIPDLGGISGAPGAGVGIPGLGPSGGSLGGLPQAEGEQYNAIQQSQLGVTPGTTLGQVMPQGYIPEGTARPGGAAPAGDLPRSGGGGGAPTGYVMWQGQLIPSGLFRVMQQTGELF